MISAFDLDHTLLRVNSSFHFCKYLCQRGYVPRWKLFFVFSYTIQHLLGLLSTKDLHNLAFQRFFFGLNPVDVQRWVDEFLHRYFNHYLYLPAIEVLQKSQEAGDVTMILSSSPNFLVEPIAKKLNISLWYATEYAIDKDCRFCHISHIVLGDEKKQKIDELRQQLGSAGTVVTAYSDSHLDLPFLLAADIRVGVNPTRQLRAICQRNHWKII